MASLRHITPQLAQLHDQGLPGLAQAAESLRQPDAVDRALVEVQQDLRGGLGAVLGCAEQVLQALMQPASMV